MALPELPTAEVVKDEIQDALSGLELPGSFDTGVIKSVLVNLINTLTGALGVPVTLPDIPDVPSTPSTPSGLPPLPALPAKAAPFKLPF